MSYIDMSNKGQIRLRGCDWILQYVLDEAQRLEITVTKGDLLKATLNRLELFKLDPNDETLFTVDEFFQMLDGKLGGAILTY